MNRAALLPRRNIAAKRETAHVVIDETMACSSCSITVRSSSLTSIISPIFRCALESSRMIGSAALLEIAHEEPFRFPRPKW
jgi:hypothetical protein